MYVCFVCLLVSDTPNIKCLHGRKAGDNKRQHSIMPMHFVLSCDHEHQPVRLTETDCAVWARMKAVAELRVILHVEQLLL